MLPVIHFGTLEELLGEFVGDKRQVVRVSQQQHTETKSGQYGLVTTTITVQVFCRAIHNGAILSYVAMSEKIERDFMSDKEETRAKYDEAWKLLEEIKVGVWRAIEEAGLTPRPGIIDLNGVAPVVGDRWTLK